MVTVDVLVAELPDELGSAVLLATLAVLARLLLLAVLLATVPRIRILTLPDAASVPCVYVPVQSVQVDPALSEY